MMFVVCITNNVKQLPGSVWESVRPTSLLTCFEFFSLSTIGDYVTASMGKPWDMYLRNLE
jgi:hypothetical protein